jgi:Tfp pilus assembly protein PilV
VIFDFRFSIFDLPAGAATPDRKKIANRKSQIENARRGYLLLETIVAMTIASVGMIGVITAMRASVAAGGHAAGVTTATMLAEQKMAEVRTVPGSTAGSQEGDFGTDYPGFAWRTILKTVDKVSFYSAVVEVSWLEAGIRRSVTLRSLVNLPTAAPAATPKPGGLP